MLIYRLSNRCQFLLHTQAYIPPESPLTCPYGRLSWRFCHEQLASSAVVKLLKIHFHIPPNRFVRFFFYWRFQDKCLIKDEKGFHGVIYFWKMWVVTQGSIRKGYVERQVKNVMFLSVRENWIDATPLSFDARSLCHLYIVRDRFTRTGLYSRYNQ